MHYCTHEEIHLHALGDSLLHTPGDTLLHTLGDARLHTLGDTLVHGLGDTSRYTRALALDIQLLLDEVNLSAGPTN
jgi:hypothetical protein